MKEQGEERDLAGGRRLVLGGMVCSLMSLLLVASHAISAVLEVLDSPREPDCFHADYVTLTFAPRVMRVELARGREAESLRLEGLLTNWPHLSWRGQAVLSWRQLLFQA